LVGEILCFYEKPFLEQMESYFHKWKSADRVDGE
jgi:hypothetical protein